MVTPAGGVGFRAGVSPKGKVLILYFICFSNFIGGVLLAFHVDRRLVWLSIAIPAIAGFAATRIRCPRCRRPVLLRSGEFLGVRWTYWNAIPIPGECSGCGFDLAESAGDRAGPGRSGGISAE